MCYDQVLEVRLEVLELQQHQGKPFKLWHCGVLQVSRRLAVYMAEYQRQQQREEQQKQQNEREQQQLQAEREQQRLQKEREQQEVQTALKAQEPPQQQQELEKHQQSQPNYSMQPEGRKNSTDAIQS